MKLIFLLLADIRGKNEERLCVYIYIFNLIYYYLTL